MERENRKNSCEAAQLSSNEEQPLEIRSSKSKGQECVSKTLLWKLKQKKELKKDGKCHAYR
jgi:hypothetical protein